MRNIKLILEYDGTKYSGWQRQKNAITIQQVLEEAIWKITGAREVTIGASRTDSGVHARGYVANFKTECKIPGIKFRDAINTKLPRDIVILNSEEVPEEFHARYNCIGKTYTYTILNRYVPPTIDRNYMYHIRGKLDIQAMKSAGELFIGTHDFSAFKSQGSGVKTSVRTIKELTVDKSGDIVIITVTADGFLYNMVRIITGTLLRVGLNKVSYDKIPEIILSKDRKKAGKCAPPQGLCLEKVYY